MKELTITVAGNAGSGKTTIAKELALHLERLGLAVEMGHGADEVDDAPEMQQERLEHLIRNAQSLKIKLQALQLRRAEHSFGSFITPIEKSLPIEVFKMPPQERTIVPPEGGWKPNTLYLVRVSFRRTNPVHESYLRTGFIAHDGAFGGYCEIFNNSYEEVKQAREAHYLQAVRVLHTAE